MTGRAWSEGPLADWVALGATAVFVAAGVVLLRYPETAILRLAALGIPPWPVYLAGLVEITAGALLLHRPARPSAALVLALVSLAGAILNFAYRQPQSALEATALAVLAGALIVVERNRS